MASSTSCLYGSRDGLGTIRATVAQQYTEVGGHKKLVVDFRPRLFGAYALQDTTADASARTWGAPPDALSLANRNGTLDHFESLKTSARNPWWIRSYRYHMSSPDTAYRIEVRLKFYKRQFGVYRRVHTIAWYPLQDCHSAEG